MWDWSNVIQLIIAFVFGAVTSILALIRKISKDELERIIAEISELVKQYQDAKADGVITTEEKLKLAEQTIEAIRTILKALED